MLYLFSELSPRVTEDLLASLLLLEDKRDGKGELHQPIYLHMHSTGGSLTNAFALLDLIKVCCSCSCFCLAAPGCRCNPTTAALPRHGDSCSSN